MVSSSFRSIYFSKDKAPVVITTGLEDHYLLNYYQVVKLGAIPSDGYQWKFIWPGGSILFTWKTSPTNAWNEILIGATAEDCLSNAMATLNLNYYFVKSFIVFVDGSPDQIRIKAKEIGSQFWAQRLGDGSTTVTLDILESDEDSGIITAHKLNYQVGLSLYKFVNGLIDGESITKVLFSEHIAPVIIIQENITEIDIQFDIQNPLHSLTKFTPPDPMQIGGKIATGHCIKFIPAVYEIYGNPPAVNEFEFKENTYVLRGGSRQENQDAWDDYLQEYVIGEIQGVLTYSLADEVTLYQEQYKYWFNTLDNLYISVEQTLVFKDNTSYNASRALFNCPINEVVIFPVGLFQTSLDIVGICTSLDKTIDDIVSYSLSLVEFYSETPKASFGNYKIVPSKFGEKYFLSETSIGGAEVFRCTGENSQSIEISKTEYNQFSVPEVYWKRKNVSQKLIEFSELYDCSTGNLSLSEVYRYINLILSENVWEIVRDNFYNGLNGYRYSIKIEPGTFLITKDKNDGEYLYGFSFRYRRSYTEHSAGLLNNSF